jgi:hypothetical protein
MYDGTNWNSYQAQNGLAANGVLAISVDTAGDLWFGTDTGMVSKFDGATWTTYSNGNCEEFNWIQAIASDAAGNMWFGSSRCGVSKLSILRVSANYANGSPGSYFNLSGEHFPVKQSVTVSVNGHTLGNIPVSSSGTFTLTLGTANAGEGLYYVGVEENLKLRLGLRLEAQDPVRPKEGDFTTIDIPAGIAFTHQYYLPILR